MTDKFVINEFKKLSHSELRMIQRNAAGAPAPEEIIGAKRV